MPENPDQILDELDGEVPTAANTYLLECDECSDIVTCRHWETFRDMKETSCEECTFGKLKPCETTVLKLEDHRKALVEAVQQERRRIKEKIEEVFEKYENGETPFDRYERAALRPFVEELEEEVEKNPGTRPKTEKSDSTS